LPQELAVFVEDGDTIQPFIGDVHITLSVERNRARPHELSIAFTVLAEFTDILLIEGTHRDVNPIRPIFIGPIHHIDHIVRGEGQIHRIPESGPGKFVAAYGMAIGEGPVLDSEKMCAHSVSFVITACIFLIP
jgi:hypothetical protein